ncbi:MAG: class I SAM-dependent DNA methyltransferase [Micavibrio aeruginosavorus]|uniref:site-specific DNA-methyltransferase (adenine-specific) n=1 Tax=Micavibrio aeruginosavorus TaxID=349221 RepID=A0A2W5A251_9BACT|nr:MAG: class I SAM-dependent DNA methyltransferase [Micavibrio aeruginosavorus]
MASAQRFIEKWQKSRLKERAAAQEHFIDLCHLLEHPTPAEADPDGTWYTFEYGAQKTTGSQGFADVWKKGHFGWEYKGKHKDLQAAYAQLQQYAPALANPPLLIVCDTDRFIIHTNWNDLVSETHEIALEELANPDKLNLLRYAFFEPDRLKPAKSRQQLTEEVAGKFATISEKLRQRGYDPQQVAHFVNRLIFCMFAEDIQLLRKGLFTDVLERSLKTPADLQRKLSSLFAAMRDGGDWGIEEILWFNGGLFDDDTALELKPDEIQMVFESAKKDWSDIDPSIMGTLFERGLDPAKQSQLGAHYTDRDMIMKIINPVIVEPLTREWEQVKIKIDEELKKAASYETVEAGSKISKKELINRAGEATKAKNRAEKAYNAYKARLKSFKVLDPACGSGNFLYLSLKALKDIEQQVNIYGEVTFRQTQSIPEIGPENIYGIEINPYAAELARVSVWIGEIQWIKKHGFQVPANPVLRNLKNIVCHDALMNEDGSEYQWPKVDVIVGNPPFIGDKKMIRELGESYTVAVRKLYDKQVPGGADFVCFWFAKVNKYMKAGWLQRGGLVSTNSIRGGKNRVVLDDLTKKFQIYNAWPDEDWVNEGASVRVSMTCFSKEKQAECKISDIIVGGIYTDLTPKENFLSVDVALIKRLKGNKNIAFQGPVKVGAFDIDGETARKMIFLPVNPNGKHNIAVLKPWINGMDIVRRPSDKWIIDFGDMGQSEACLYEAPFKYALENIKPERDKNRDKSRKENWWRLGRSGNDIKSALSKIDRCIVTPRVSKYRLFRWASSKILPDSAVVAIARDDDTTFGILSSKHHELWSLKLCTWLGVGNDPRYTPSTTFETFPFPKGMEPNQPASELAKNSKAQKIAEAARKLNELRENWLNPAGSIKRVPEVVPGYPDRIVPADKAAEKILAKRTLTNLYNDKPTWLQNAHKELDDAIAEAYGWPTDLTDDEILEKLFALNQHRAKGD